MLRLFFIGIFFLPLILVAQNFNGGIIGGITASEISGDQLSGPNKLGPLAGLYIDHTLTENMFFEIDMTYVQKGSRKNPHNQQGDFTKYILRINTIEMPFLLGFKYRESICFVVGPSLGYLFSEKEIDQNGVIPRSPTAPPFKKYELSLLGGVRYELDEHKFISVRYSTSLLPVRDHASYTTYRLNRGQYNSVWYINFQYTF